MVVTLFLKGFLPAGGLGAFDGGGGAYDGCVLRNVAENGGSRRGIASWNMVFSGSYANISHRH
jgi:hypothetical protein